MTQSGTEQDTDLLPILRDIARPGLVWAAHFIFVYAALSAACADRGLIAYTSVDAMVLVATLAALPAAGWSVFRRGSSELRRSARWSGIISSLAILFTAAPLMLIGSCG